MNILIFLTAVLMGSARAQTAAQPNDPNSQCGRVSAECFETAASAAVRSAQKIQANNDHAQAPVVWSIDRVYMEPLPKNKKLREKILALPDHNYTVILRSESLVATEMFIMREDELAPLLGYFRVKSIPELAGKSFPSSERWAQDGLRLLLREIQDGKAGTAP